LAAQRPFVPIPGLAPPDRPRHEKPKRQGFNRAQFPAFRQHHRQDVAAAADRRYGCESLWKEAASFQAP